MFNRLRLIIFTGMTLSLVTGMWIGTELSRPDLGGTSSQTLDLITNGAVKEEVNQYRVQNGFGTLKSSGSLDKSAQDRAEFLCANNKWSHDGWTVGLKAYRATKIGENLEYGNYYQTPGTIVQAWVNSPTHNANMLDPDFTEQGMGIRYCEEYQGYEEVIIVVNHFGRPQ